MVLSTLDEMAESAENWGESPIDIPTVFRPPGSGTKLSPLIATYRDPALIAIMSQARPRTPAINTAWISKLPKQKFNHHRPQWFRFVARCSCSGLLSAWSSAIIRITLLKFRLIKHCEVRLTDSPGPVQLLAVGGPVSSDPIFARYAPRLTSVNSPRS